MRRLTVPGRIAPKFCSAAGFQQHYVDEGSGRPVVMLHGQPTWGYIYRRFIAPIAATHRVIVPDHMGFGKSETPPDREYTLSTHVANLTALDRNARPARHHAW